MKNLFLLFILGIVVFVIVPAQAQDNLQAYFSNNPGPGGAADQQIRLINYGSNGTPLTSPVGDVCANIYVFDANQEMVSCCSCRITPNGLLTLSVANGLTNNPVTSVVPVNGDVVIIPILAGPFCDPVNWISVDLGGGIGIGFPNSVVGFSTHLQTSGGTTPGTFITETTIPNVGPFKGNAEFLRQSCQFAQYLGSGKGRCSCK